MSGQPHIARVRAEAWEDDPGAVMSTLSQGVGGLPIEVVQIDRDPDTMEYVVHYVNLL